MENQILFKKAAFGGFERTSVLEYIDYLNAAARAANDELRVQLDQALSSRVELGTMLIEAKKSNESLQEQYLQIKEEKDKLADRISLLENEILTSHDNESQHKREVLFEQEKNQRLRAKIQELEECGKHYDDMSAQVGNVIMRAQASANQIVEEARWESEELIKNNSAMIETVCSDYQSLCEKIESLQNDASLATQEYNQRLANVKNKLEEAIAKLQPDDIIIGFNAEKKDADSFEQNLPDDLSFFR